MDADRPDPGPGGPPESGAGRAADWKQAPDLGRAALDRLAERLARLPAGHPSSPDYQAGGADGPEDPDAVDAAGGGADAGGPADGGAGATGGRVTRGWPWQRGDGTPKGQEPGNPGRPGGRDIQSLLDRLPRLGGLAARPPGGTGHPRPGRAGPGRLAPRPPAGPRRPWFTDGPDEPWFTGHADDPWFTGSGEGPA